ncbi:hypothetical protein [Methylobacterium sp. 37f]|uniref:DUF6894 family protein n=1 Tax=Methylobacterium sp. 37f TaxID=2817058 RepID=UPI001FFD5AC2|nr:hypothetical protein [Methylobacterium sp. 37f]MCK2054755.1 hypothetical protein [Methylobacterium sp. 37f]
MAKFYFNVCDKGERIADTIDVECDSLGAAFQQAKTMITQFRSACDASACTWADWALEVRYSDMSELFRLPFTMVHART